MKKYLSLVKFSHTIFALPFALIGFFLAVRVHGYPFEWRIFFLVLLCMAFARNAAMAFNRYADRFIDASNERTSGREIPSGKMKARSVVFFVFVNAALFIAAAWLINPLCGILSPLALLIVLGYSYTKRFTALCHLVLGLGLSLAPLGAYIAVSQQFHILPLLFSGIVLLWVSGFDIIYALQDESFDRQMKLHSIPAAIGPGRALQLSSILHALCAALLVVAGLLGAFGIWYWIGAALFAALLRYQHSLVSVGDLSRVNLAFFTTNGIASVLFAAFVITDLW